jgi:hypothetical protein
MCAFDYFHIGISNLDLHDLRSGIYPVPIFFENEVRGYITQETHETIIRLSFSWTIDRILRT